MLTTVTYCSFIVVIIIGKFSPKGLVTNYGEAGGGYKTGGTKSLSYAEGGAQKVSTL